MQFKNRIANRFQFLLIGLIAAALNAGTSGTTTGQAYTYDPPTCGAPYREEPHKPQQLRVTWEMSSAQLCVQQNKFPIACRHLQAAIGAADRMGPDGGNPDGIKAYIASMMRTHGCQQ